jgi:predicted GIY-YIG superfamily endonuclease
MHQIYIIHNIIDNKIYVGKSANPIKRWIKHNSIAQSKRKREKFYLHSAIQKYKKQNFTFSIIQNFKSEQECSLAEIYWINYFQSNNNKYGYNQK